MAIEHTCDINMKVVRGNIDERLVIALWHYVDSNKGATQSMSNQHRQSGR